jgi:hypothetical protein
MDYFDKHSGETALLVGNGPNLYKTPPELFDYPSFGLNTIHKYEGWKPTYYVAVDYCIYEGFGEAINSAFPDIPKFVPSPVADQWTGKNFYRFPKKTGDIKIPVNRQNTLKDGFVFYNVMHAAMMVAWYMGFTTLLLIGVEQKPEVGALREHFWGTDIDTPESQTDVHWNIGYQVLSHALHIKVLNISQDTYVPENILARGDWRDYANDKPS